MSKTIPKMQDIQQQQMFSYIFYLNDAYQIRLLKVGCSIGFFYNCSYKTFYLKYKSKLWIFSNPNEFVSIK